MKRSLKQKKANRKELFEILNESISYLIAYGIPYSEVMTLSSGFYFKFLKIFGKMIETKMNTGLN